MWLGGASEGRAVARSTSYSGAGQRAQQGRRQRREASAQASGQEADQSPSAPSAGRREEGSGQREEGGGEDGHLVALGGLWGGDSSAEPCVTRRRQTCEATTGSCWVSWVVLLLRVTTRVPICVP